MKPIRAPAVLVITLECWVPSSVSGHLVVPKPPVNETDAKVALIDWLVALSLLADAELTSAPRRTVAPTTDRSNLKSFMNTSYGR
jgi:hypothetical protein